MFYIYGIHLGKRYYPDDKFEKFTKIKGKKEIVTLGWYCINDDAEILKFVEIDGGYTLYRVINNRLDDTKKLEVISENDALTVFEQAKNHLKRNEQLIYYEVYGEKKLNGLQGLEFCGYELMDRFCGISVNTGCGDIIAKYVDKLNNFGLFNTIEDALVVQKQIKINNDHEDAANSLIYAIWRFLKY